MFFSVIIPTYNPDDKIVVLLNSIIANQCKDEIEVILADDCSTIDLNNIIEIYPELNIKIIVNQKHAGFPRMGRQNGLDAAQGEWITFAD